jgi:hypothetical protein
LSALPKSQLFLIFGITADFYGLIKRSTLADANEDRDWGIYADFAHILINLARPLYAETDLGLNLDATKDRKLYHRFVPERRKGHPQFPAQGYSGQEGRLNLRGFRPGARKDRGSLYRGRLYRRK